MSGTMTRQRAERCVASSSKSRLLRVSPCRHSTTGALADGAAYTRLKRRRPSWLLNQYSAGGICSPTAGTSVMRCVPATAILNRENEVPPQLSRRKLRGRTQTRDAARAPRSTEEEGQGLPLSRYPCRARQL